MKRLLLATALIAAPMLAHPCFAQGAADTPKIDPARLSAHIKVLSSDAFEGRAPTTPAEAKGLLKSAIRCDDPVIFLESEKMLNDKGGIECDLTVARIAENEYYIVTGTGCD